MEISPISSPNPLSNDWLSKTISFFESGHFHNLIFPVKILFIVLSLIFLIAILYWAIHTDYLYYLWFEDFDELLKRKKKYTIKKHIKKHKSMFRAISNIFIPKKVKLGKQEFQRAEEKIDKGKEIDYKLALLDIDRLIDQELAKRGIKGRNLSEKLEKVPGGMIKNIGELKTAREFVNKILREEKTELNQEEAKRVLETYKTALKQLKLI